MNKMLVRQQDCILQSLKDTDEHIFVFHVMFGVLQAHIQKQMVIKRRKKTI